MKKKTIKKENKSKSQLDLFRESENTTVIVSQATQENQSASKIISLSDYQHQLDIKKFYEVANKVTSHLK